MPRPLYSRGTISQGWAAPRTGLDYTEKRKFLTLLGFELRPIGRAIRSQSLLLSHIKLPKGYNFIISILLYTAVCARFLHAFRGPILRTKTFRKLNLFPFSGEKAEEVHTQVGPLARLMKTRPNSCKLFTYTGTTGSLF
jgi:hypothetical protein